MTAHPVGYDTLIALALGEPVYHETEALTSHLAACPECQRAIRLLQSARDTTQLDARAIPSAAALARVRALMPSPATPAGSPFAGLKRVFGALAFDGRQAYAAAGLRGSSDAYLLSYTQGEAALDLQIEPPSDDDGVSWHITGQIDAPDLATPAEIAVLGGRATRALTTTDAFGVFAVTIAPGNYDLLIGLGDRVIVFPEVEVG